jgi:RNA polymerase sigma-70 factor, ECF subfamily
MAPVTACLPKLTTASLKAVVTTIPPSEPPDATLGAVLYPRNGQSRVPEADWVRLLEAVGAGDPLALRELYERSHRLVFTLIMRITRNRETAEELTLDVFHDIWRRASQYDSQGGTVLGWIMNQARSRAIDRLRYERRKKRVDPFPTEASSQQPAASSEERCESDEQGRVLRNALTSLTPDEREAIETAFFAELTHSEVASRLNQPLGTIKTRIRSGFAKLRQLLGAGVKPL